MSSSRLLGLLISQLLPSSPASSSVDTSGSLNFAAVGIGLVPAMLLVFPIIRHWYGGRLSFKLWLLMMAGIIIAGTLVHLVIG